MKNTSKESAVDKFLPSALTRSVDSGILGKITSVEKLPNETMLGTMSPDAISSHPWNSKRIGRVQRVPDTTRDFREFRAIYTYDAQESHTGNHEPVLAEQLNHEAFYGYYLEEDIGTLPKLEHLRIGEAKIVREGKVLVPIFIGHRRTVKAPKPPSIPRVKKIVDAIPKQPRVRRTRVKPSEKTVTPAIVHHPEVLRDSLPIPPTQPIAKSVGWDAGDKVKVRILSGVAFCKAFQLSDGFVVIPSDTMLDGVIVKHNNVLWLQIEVPEGGVVQKSLGSVLTLKDRIEIIR